MIHRRRGHRAHRALVLGLLLIGLAGCGAPTPTGGGGGDDPELECTREGYPCSIADVPGAVRAASLAALESAYDALAAGTMDDAVAVLEARDDVVELDTDGRLLRFRLDGGGPTFLYDVTGLSSDAPTLGAGPEAGSEFESRVATPHPATGESTLAPTAVVGSDQNGDGSKDQRDAKSALFLSPYKWDWWEDQGDVLAGNLNVTPPYTGRVDYIDNPTEDAQNLTLEDYRSWYLYDFVFVATHGQRMTSRAGTTYVVLSSGVRVDATEPIPRVRGSWYLGMVDRNRTESSRLIEWGLSRDFFYEAYGDGLDDTMLVFVSCETGAAGASELAQAIGGDDFVMFGWTEIVYISDGYATSLVFMADLMAGLRSEEALARLESQGLATGTAVTIYPAPVFTRFAPNGGDLRLREIVTLVDDASTPLAPGTYLSSSLSGPAGDGTPDTLTLTTRIDGVVEGTEDDYLVRYELGGVEAPGVYDLAGATRVNEETLEVTHAVALGQDAPTGTSQLVATVDLPELGTSRYVVDVQFVSCQFDATVSGDFSGAFDGPAHLVVGDDGAVTIELSSRDYVTDGVGGVDVFTAIVQTGPGSATIAPHAVSAASANQYQSGALEFQALYDASDPDFDCASCGGSLTLEALDDTTAAGSLTTTMPVWNPDTGSGNDPYLITVDATFVAVAGSPFAGTSPWVQCLAQYGGE